MKSTLTLPPQERFALHLVRLRYTITLSFVSASVRLKFASLTSVRETISILDQLRFILCFVLASVWARSRFHPHLVALAIRFSFGKASEICLCVSLGLNSVRLLGFTFFTVLNSLKNK